ncbi:hypothetical protein GCM10028795_14950 [Lysobacter olei]
MSDNTPTDAGKPARKPRKSAPRRRKPATKAAAKAETIAPDAAPETQVTDTDAPSPQASQLLTEAPAPEAAPPQARRPKAEGQGASPSPRQATPSTAASPGPRVLIHVPLGVRWRDLDAFNHVNNSKYLSYLEEARLQWMLTMPGQGLDDHVAPVVAAANLNYRRPIEWPNEVMVELFVERLGNTSVTIGHRIVARNDASVLYCDGNVVLVWIDRGTGAAAPLPAEVRTACR